jgi:hypothetical protein
MKISFVKNAEALSWREFYPLPHLWEEYRNICQAERAAVEKSVVSPLPALMATHVGVNKNFLINPTFVISC